MQNELLKDLESEFGSVQYLRNLALNFDTALLTFMLEKSKFKDEFKRRFFIESKQSLNDKQNIESSSNKNENIESSVSYNKNIESKKGVSNKNIESNLSKRENIESGLRDKENIESSFSNSKSMESKVSNSENIESKGVAKSSDKGNIESSSNKNENTESGFSNSKNIESKQSLSDKQNIESKVSKSENTESSVSERQKAFVIFKQQEFLYFLNLRILNSSFTEFSSKIGLSDKNRNFLIKNNDVVINFAFKDCVLKGNKDKDDKEKTKEIFFNEIVARDEIDLLTAPKVIYNFEFIESNIDMATKDFKDCMFDATTIARLVLNDYNLLLKGNNLIALYSLLPLYANKIKLIYIDPPYNTGNDSFTYNDNFSHSTWLTFMKNRLEIARHFLRDDGVIFIQCDDNEQAYLKVLCDEIFGRENFVGCIARQTRSGGGFGISDVGITHDYILVFAKNRPNMQLNKIDKEIKEIEKYFNMKDEKGKFHKRELKQSETQAGSREERPFMFYPILTKDNNIKSITKKEFEQIYDKNKKSFNDNFLTELKNTYKDYEFILPINTDSGFGRWTCGFDGFIELLEKQELMVDSSKIYKKEYLNDTRNSKVATFLFNENDFFNGIATNEIKALFLDSIESKTTGGGGTLSK